MTHDEMYDVFLYMMRHRIPNAKIVYLDDGVSVVFNWDQERFERGTGLIYNTYDKIMPVLKALAKKQEALDEYRNAISY